jgi:hypothetical protein
MRITVERFIDCAWLMGFNNIHSAESHLLDSRFISDLSSCAASKGIEVHYIDFKEYTDPIEAITDVKNTEFRKAIDGVQQPTILIFDNCDSLSPLSCSLTFTLRSILTTQIDGNIKSFFIAKQKSLDMMFNNSKVAFYQSNYSITDRFK